MKHRTRLTTLAATLLLLALPSAGDAQFSSLFALESSDGGSSNPFTLPLGFRLLCSNPTSSQCHDDDWLESGCGKEKRHLCEDLWRQDAEQYDAPRLLNAVPEEFHRSGIAYTKQVPRERQQVDITPDPRSYSSMELASVYHPTPGLAGYNKYQVWNDNGTQVRSCDEYVYEKYYGVTRFARKVGTARDDSRRVVDLAFADVDADWAVGTRHETWSTGRHVAGWDGTPLPVAMWIGPHLEIPDEAPERHPFMRKLPKRLDAAIRLAHRSGRRALEALDGLSRSERQRAQSWTEQRWLNENLSYEGRPRPSTLPLASRRLDNDDFDVDPNDTDALGSLLGHNEAAGVPRRYLDDELNEWFKRGEKYLSLIKEWRALDERYEDSGWTIDALRPSRPPLVNDKFAAPSRAVPVAANQPSRFSLRRHNAAPTAATVSSSLRTVDVATVRIDSAETAARRRVVNELGKLLAKARTAGCFAADELCPADWSPMAFATRVLGRFQSYMDRDAAWCESFAQSFGANSGLNQLDDVADRLVSYTPPEILPEHERDTLRCHVRAPSRLTRASLESFMRGAATCRANRERGEALASALEEAFEKLAQEGPDTFFDEDGALRETSWETSADQILGSEHFGVGMHYDIRYGIERDPDHDVLNPSICGSDYYISSYTAVKAHVLTKEKELMVVDAAVDTRDGADPPNLRAKIIGHEAFEKKASQDDGGSLEWNIVDKSFDWAKTQKVVEFTYWLGPVPLTLEAGFAGRIGVDVDVYAGLQGLDGNNCIDGYVRTVAKPLASVSGYLFAGISLIDQIKAGVRGFLTIIELGLPLEAKVTLGVGDDEEGNFNINLGVETSLSVDVTTLSGRFEVYAKAFIVDWSKVLHSWPGITDSRHIFAHSYDVDLISLHNAYAFSELN